MNHAPTNFFPPDTAPVVYNGSPTWSHHARDLDTYMCWLATQRIQHPWVAGNYFSSGQRYELVVRVPQFCRFVGFEAMATGHGVITFSNGDDSYDVDLLVTNGSGTSHDIADQQLFGLTTGMSAAAQNGEARALDVTFSKEPRFVYHDWSIVDEGGGATLRVYAIRPVYLRVDGSEDLSAAA